ncbi:hypothetical protein [Pseudobdellovibrio sp. HCB154]|uniref:hypothetical protein n=1 Tax=Pseudobdellovibrio sp. HCB154 TaxID=3386277 RepID=UPI0039174663
MFKSLFTMRLLFFSYLILVTFMVTACQKNTQDDGTPTTDCLNYPQACQTSYYNQPGFTPYNYNNGYGYGYQQGGVFYNNGYYGSGTSPFHQMYNSAYLCNCPAGSVPTYNNYAGLGCVQSNMLGGGFQGYAYYGYNTSNNNQWMNIPQISNVTGYNNSSCYNGVVQSCIVSDQATCRTGFTCRASSAASAIGICVSNGANGQGGQIWR